LTVGTVNAISLYLELLAPIAIWLAWVRWRSRPFCVALALLAGSALVVTGSRGAWLGVVGGAVVFLVLLWFAAGRPRPRLDGAARRTAVVGTVAVLVAVVIVGPVLLDRLLSGDAGRLELWSAAASMIASSPIVGVGPGAWPGLRPLTAISDANLAVLATSHDSVLQILVETGVVGLLAAMWLVAVIGRLGWIAATRATRRTDRTTAAIALASLAAAAIHSIVDTQFHLPAVVLLVSHLVARVELVASPPADPEAAADPRRSGRLATMAAVTIAGVVLLVPIDIAMVRATLGNQALDRGDAAAAAVEFDAAVAMHDLAPYRLGQAIARSRLGDRAGADLALAAMERTQPFTFVVAQRAATSDDPTTSLERLSRDPDYDPTASVNAAVIGFASDPAAATSHLAAAMARVPTLVFSVRPPELFDASTWSEAQRAAIDRIGGTDPVMAVAVATLAGLPQEAADHLVTVGDGAERDALALLAAGDAGHIDAAARLLRAHPGSVGVQDVLWLLGFEAGSQPILDAVQAVAVPLRFNVPLVPMELVVDGRIDAGWSMRLPRWPMASDARNGPKRPYIDRFVTIEPVYRPKP
jgi:hypothetical protein